MQLHMILPQEARAKYLDADKPAVPEGYRLRTFREGDETAYVSLMRTAFPGWSKAMLTRTLENMLPDGLFFVEHLPTASLVASTVAGHEASELHGSAAELGWVVVHPEHQGNGLGRIVCDATLRRFVAAGFPDIYLKTDDWRFPAISIYLKLGFVPLIHGTDMPERWKLVYTRLGLDPARVENDAVRTTRGDTATDGYQPWRQEPTRDTPNLVVGFLPLFLDLYDRLRPDLKQSLTGFVDRVRAAVKIPGVEIVDAPIATLREHVDTAKSRFSEADVDLVVTMHLAYSPSLLVAEFLSKLEVPILVLDTTPAQSFELQDDSYLLENHGVHGVMDLTSVLVSKGVDFRVTAGHVADEAFTSKVAAELRGALMAKRFKNQRIGVTGTPFVGMGDFAISTDGLKDRFGIEAVNITPEAIVQSAAEISDEDVTRQQDEDRAAFDTASIDESVHRRSIRTYLGISRLCEQRGLSGYTMNFEHTGPTLPPPFYAASRLMSDGIGYAGEGDVVTAALGRAFNSGEARAMFSEVFCVDWAHDEILFSHMGEIDPRFAQSGAIVERTALGHESPSSIFRFRAEPMDVTMVNVGVGEGIPVRMVAARLSIFEHDLAPGVEGPHFFARPAGSVTGFLEDYARAGGGHHVYLCEGDVVEQVRIMCMHLSLEFSEVS